MWNRGVGVRSSALKKKSIKLPTVDGKKMTREQAAELSLEEVKAIVEEQVPGAFKAKSKKTKAKAKPTTAKKKATTKKKAPAKKKATARK